MNGLKLILTALLIAVNAFFVIAEYALVRSRRARLELMRDEGARGAALALEQLGNINEYISAVQIGVTMTSIGIGALGEPALAAILKGALGDTLSHGVAVAISPAVAFLLIAAAQLIARRDGAEVLRDRPRRGGRPTGRAPAAGVQRRVQPVIVVLTAVVGPDPAPARRRHASRERRGGSPDELKRLIAESYAGGHIDPGEAGMLTGVFHLHEQEARQVMTPIPAVVTVDVSAGRGDGAAPVHLERPHPAGRHRGGGPRPRARARPRQHAR